jgi:hypothetical protein
LEIINGEAYCFMQLIEWSAHIKIPGMIYAGAVSEYRIYLTALNSGDFEYVFDRGKLLKGGINNPDEFVRTKFQKLFKDNVDTWFKSDGNGILNLQEMEKLFGSSMISNIKNAIDDIENPFYQRIIKVQ